MELGPDNNPGNARWCPEHRRLECTKNRRHGRGPCHALAIKGADACGLHSGRKLEELKAEGRAVIQAHITQKITAWNAEGDVNGAISTSNAVLGVLQMSWMRLAAYSELLRRQVMAEGGEIRSADRYDERGLPSAEGLIGHRFGAAGKDGNIFAQSEEIRALVRLEAAERDRVVKYAETVHKMGISGRLAQMAERWGDLVATRISIMFDGLDLTPEQQAMVPRLIQAHLGSIDMTAIEGSEEKR